MFAQGLRLPSSSHSESANFLSQQWFNSPSPIDLSTIRAMASRMLPAPSLRSFNPSHPLRLRLLPPSRNYAAKSKSKKAKLEPLTPVLEKPDRFRPPSHPRRIVKTPRHFPGPPLSEEELAAQRTKRYPNMFPPEGTRLHWFLTNKAIHAVIAMVCFNCSVSRKYIGEQPLIPPALRAFSFP
jgi:hypothetical protein